MLINGRSAGDLCAVEKVLRIPYTSKLQEVYEQTLSSFDSEVESANQFRLIECADAVFTMKRVFSHSEIRTVSFLLFCMVLF